MPSDKKVIYVDAETHRKLAMIAAERGTTIGRLVAALVSAHLHKPKPH